MVWMKEERDADGSSGWRFSRRIDITTIIALISLFLAGVGGVVRVWKVTEDQILSNKTDTDKQISLLQSAIMQSNGRSDLLQQRIEQDERTSGKLAEQLDRFIADVRDHNKSFEAEVRSYYQQIMQANADLRTLVASQADGSKRR